MPERYLRHKKKSPIKIGLNMNWRRGRDSNSGRGCPLDGFQDRCIKPLCHLSINTYTFKTFTKPSQKTSFYRRFAAHRGWPHSSPIFASLRFQDRCIKPLCHLSIGVCDLRKTFYPNSNKRSSTFFSFVINFYKYQEHHLTKQ